MAQLPPNFILEQIKALEGGAKVTFPGSNSDVKKVERVMRLPRNNWEIPIYTPDVEHTTTILVAQIKMNEDAQWATVYREYQTLPGLMLTGIETDQETSVQITTTRQNVKAHSTIPANTPGIIWEHQPYDDAISIRVSRDITNLLNKTFTSYPDFSYSFPGLLIVRGGTLSSDRQPSSSRSGFSKTVRSRVELTFTETAQDRTGEIFDTRMVNVRSDAGTFSSVLHNLRSAVVGGRRQPVEPSVPTSVEYPIGAEVLIRAPSILSVNGLYRNEATFITLQ